MPMFYRLILLNIYADGRISNVTSIHPTQDNASERALAHLEAGSSEGFVIIEEHQNENDWCVVDHAGLGELYSVNTSNGVFRIERALQPV